MIFIGYIFIGLLTSAAQADPGSCSSNDGGGSAALAQCKQASCQAQQNCLNRANQTKANIQQTSNQMADHYSSNPSMHNSGKDLGSLTAKSSEAYSQAAEYCRQQQNELCEKKCDPSKDKKKEKELNEEKQRCAQAIAEMTGPLDAGANDSKEASKSANESGKQSGGQPGGGQQQGDKGKEEQKPQQSQNEGEKAKSGDPNADNNANKESTKNDPLGLNKQADCSSPQGVTDARCTGQLSGICSRPDQSGTALCKAFSDHFCGNSRSGVSGGVVQPGEGVGKDFCQGINVRRFCNNPAAAQCPSCQQASGGAVVGDLKNLPAICQTDPMHLQSAAVGGGMTPSSVGGGLASGGGSGSGSSATYSTSASAATLDSEKKDRARSEVKRKDAGWDMSADGGGGGGGPSSGSGGGASFVFNPQSSRGASRGAAPHKDYPLPPLVSDVEKRFGRNVFTISTEVIRKRCASGQLLHCGPEK